MKTVKKQLMTFFIAGHPVYETLSPNLTEVASAPSLLKPKPLSILPFESSDKIYQQTKELYNTVLTDLDKYESTSDGQQNYRLIQGAIGRNVCWSKNQIWSNFKKALHILDLQIIDTYKTFKVRLESYFKQKHKQHRKDNVNLNKSH